MSFYTTTDIINFVGMNDTGYELKEEYKSIERKIEDIRKDYDSNVYINVCAKVGNVQYLKYMHENGFSMG